MWLRLVTAAMFVTMVTTQNDRTGMDCILTNVDGCKMIRDPTYLIVAPAKVRPMQVINVFVSVLKLEHKDVNIRVSIVKDQVEHAADMLHFDSPGSKIMELRLPNNAMVGKYKMKVEGTLAWADSGAIFFNETDILFDKKQASVFIQLSKPMYRQEQTVRFRIIPILPNLLPKHGSMSVYMLDPTGTPVRRWQGQQTNAGGFVEQSFELSDQPAYGDWSIKVDAYGYAYIQKFKVVEYYQERFEVNVTVPPFVLSDTNGINVTVFANHTSGRAVVGNATIMLTVVKRNEKYNYLDTSNLLPPIYRDVDYFDNGRLDFTFYKEDILKHADVSTLNGMEFIFNVSVFDWELLMNRSGYGSSFCHESRIILKWVGGRSRSFKPDSVFSATVAIMYADGTPVVNTTTPITVTPTVTGTESSQLSPQSRMPVDGFATFPIYVDKSATMVQFQARHDIERSNSIELRGYRYFSPGGHYITVTTSTRNPRVNEYIIFHVKTSVYVPKIYYLIVSQGNILIGDEMLMISRQKTFSVALSRDMVPTARIVVYYVRQPEEVVVDTLNFFVNGTRLNPIHIGFNRGKDFTHQTVEVNVRSDPGAYVAIAGLPYDLYARGLTDGLSENLVIDELLTYDAHANGSHLHKWRVSETEYLYKFFTASGHGIDASQTFRMAGLNVMTDADVPKLPNDRKCREQSTEKIKWFPCSNGEGCFNDQNQCDLTLDCYDGSDEFGCPVAELNLHQKHPMERISQIMRFFDDSEWIWEQHWVKPDGRVDFRVDVPRFPLTWVINGFSLSPEKGFGIIERPARFDATRVMYIQVEAPVYVVRGEQIGFRVSIFNYWYGDDFLEVLVKLHNSPNYEFVNVEDYGFVNSYNPRTTSGEHMTLVYLEAGESRDIYMPVLPRRWIDDKVDVTISATSYLSSDIVTKTLHVQYNGILNWYHTPYLIDLITKGAETIPDIDIPIRDTYMIPETREFAFVPGSPTATVSVFGDVVTPGFFERYLNAENVLNRPYGSGEMNMFNLAYNLYTLLFKKAAKQLDNEELTSALYYMNIGLQRQLSYMTNNGSFLMFRDDPVSSLWLTAFVGKTLSEMHVAEWDNLLFIPTHLVNRIVLWVCAQQNESGAFHPLGPVYDRKMATLGDQKKSYSYNHPVPLTAYILIALKKITLISEDAIRVVEKSVSLAQKYLSRVVLDIKDEDVFHLAITTYALSLTTERNVDAYNKLYNMARKDGEMYWSTEPVIPIPSKILNTVKVLEARIESPNDGYATQTTAYALMALLGHSGSSDDRNSIMTWLQSMRNTMAGFASTQDTLVAMEALIAFTEIDPNRNYFDVTMQMSSTSKWDQWHRMTASNYTTALINNLPNAWGYVQMRAQGTGRSLLQVSSTARVEYPWQIKQPHTKAFNLTLDEFTWGGRNYSRVDMTACARWFLTSRSVRSGLAVMEIDIPSGFVVMNTTLRRLVQSGTVPKLKRAEFYWRKVVFYFTYLDDSKTCVKFSANRWYPIANGTEHHMMRVYDYYEPGLYNNTMYSTVNLFNLNLCFACASFQCPYCPQFNAATVVKTTVTTLGLLLYAITRRFLSWV